MTPEQIGTPEANEHENRVIESIVKPRGQESLRDRLERWFLYFVIVAVFVGGPSLYVVYKIAHSTQQNLSLICPAFKDVANSKIPPATTPVTAGTPASIQVIGDLRIAYLAFCVPKFGVLDPVADPRLAAFLKSRGH